MPQKPTLLAQARVPKSGSGKKPAPKKGTLLSQAKVTKTSGKKTVAKLAAQKARQKKVAAAKSACQQRAAHRKAQAKYVQKNPQAQAQRVKQSQQKQKQAGKTPPKKTKGAGQHGSQVGRPRKVCLSNEPVRGTITVDLTGDGHGRHVAGTPYIYSHGWHLLKAGAPAPGDTSMPNPASHVRLVEGQGHKTSAKMGKEDIQTHRHILALSNTARTELYKANGLTLKFPDVAEHELLDRIKSEKNPETRAELVEDAKKRMEVLRLTLHAVERADRDAKRDKTRLRAAAFDYQLRKIKGGASIIRLRNKLLSDHSLDRLGFVAQHGGGIAKDVAIRVGTATAIGLILGPIGAAAGLVGGVALQEGLHKVVESLIGGAGVEHLVEKHLVERVYDTAIEAAKRGGEKVKAVHKDEIRARAKAAIRAEKAAKTAAGWASKAWPIKGSKAKTKSTFQITQSVHASGPSHRASSLAAVTGGKHKAV